MGWSDYKKVREIGSGSFGRAYLVTSARSDDRDRRPMVLKEINMQTMDSKARQSAEGEARVLHSLKHPYIVRYAESFVHDQCLCIVMDYCEGGDLWQFIAERRKTHSRTPESVVVRWFTQLCLALKHIHDKNVLHRDIKSQNVFLDKKDGRSHNGRISCVKIADFGIAKVLDSRNSLARTQVGTPYYLSPEMCQKQPYATPSDVWALGCVLFEMCALHVPFEASNLEQLVNKIVRCSPPQVPSTYSKELGAICGELLSRKACDRPPVEKVLQRPLLQGEIKKMIDENKKTGHGGDDERGRPDSARPRSSSQHQDLARPRSGSQHQQDSCRPRSGSHHRGVLQERNHSNDPHDRRPSSNKPGAREPSPHREAAKHILRHGRAPSPGPASQENRPQSARYLPLGMNREQPRTPRRDFGRNL